MGEMGRSESLLYLNLSVLRLLFPIAEFHNPGRLGTSFLLLRESESIVGECDSNIMDMNANFAHLKVPDLKTPRNSRFK